MRKRSKKPGIFIVIIGIIIALFFIRLVKQGYSVFQTYRETSKTEERVQALEKEQKDLTEEKENLGDIKYIEKIAREEHNMVRQGEIPLFIIDEKDKEAKDKETKDNQDAKSAEEKPQNQKEEKPADNKQ